MLFHPHRLLTLKTLLAKKDNQRARATGIQFIAAQQSSPDILVVAGQPRSGKTHLLHALANFAKRNEAICSIACVSAVQFADEVMRGRLYCDLEKVLKRFAREGLFAVDDVDRLIYQPESADALFNVLRMRQARKQRTLLTTTLSLAPASNHPLSEFLGQQLAVRLN